MWIKIKQRYKHNTLRSQIFQNHRNLRSNITNMFCHRFKPFSQLKELPVKFLISSISPLYENTGQFSMMWCVVCFGSPQIQLGSSVWFHLNNMSLHRPWPVRNRFKLHRIFRGNENSFFLFLCESKSNIALSYPLSCQARFQFSWISKLHECSWRAVFIDGFRDFNLSSGVSNRSWWSGMLLFPMALRYSLSSTFSLLRWGGGILLSADNHGSGVELTVPVMIRMALLSSASIFVTWTLFSHVEQQYSAAE